MNSESIMTSIQKSNSEIKSWLNTLLKSEDLENFEFSILGNSEKGDGFMGDIVFVEVSGTTKDKDTKKYDLVLKCSKTSQKLRANSPVKVAFLSEIYFYDVVLPSFLKFQRDRNIAEPFEKVPKCLGTFSTDTMEVIALENLKSKGYILWEKAKPLTRKHVDIVVKEYAKLHAISIAMNDQDPEKFQELVNGLDNVLDRFSKTTEMITVIEDAVQEVYGLLQNDLDKSILEKWLQLKEKVRPFYEKIYDNLESLEVIVHGDCWSNNFLHYHIDNEPSDFAILDWQLITYSSPVVDLSYFFFACLSEEDMNDYDSILHYYYKNLSEHVEKLGSDLNSVYPMSQFLDDWKKFSKFGVTVTTVIHKSSLSEENEVPDMSEAAENDEDVMKAFSQPIKNIDDYKNRMRYIVKFVVANDLI